jgi:hypothetical protein
MLRGGWCGCVHFSWRYPVLVGQREGQDAKSKSECARSPCRDVALPSRQQARHSSGYILFYGDMPVEARKTDPVTGLRRVLIFQLKLGADALRDLVMSPVSIVMFLLDVVLRPSPEQSYYEQLMKFGRKSDRWINLFDEHKDDVSERTVEREQGG